MKFGEGIIFASLALGLHLSAFWAFTGDPSAAGAGEGGASLSSLTLDGGSYAALVEAWDTPPSQTSDVSPLAPSQNSEASPQAAPTVDMRPTQAPLSELSTPEGESPLTPPAPVIRAPVKIAKTPQLSQPSLNSDSAPTLRSQGGLPQLAPQQPPILAQAKPQNLAPALDSTPPQPERFAPTSSQRPLARPQRASAPKVVQKASGQSKNKVTSKTAGSAKTATQGTTSNKASQEALASWSSQVRRAIERKKRYPRGTRASGTAVVSLTVSKAGQLLGASLKRGSGTKALDKAALNAVKTARYPAAPKVVTRKSATFQVSITLKR